MEFILMAFPKKIFFGTDEPFMAQNGASFFASSMSSKDCFTILHN